MWDAFTIISSNVGMTFVNLVLMIVVLGCGTFFAKDFKIGVIAVMVCSGGLFAWFYEAGLNYVPSMVVFFMSLVVLTFTLLTVSKVVDKGGVI